MDPSKLSAGRLTGHLICMGPIFNPFSTPIPYSTHFHCAHYNIKSIISKFRYLKKKQLKHYQHFLISLFKKSSCNIFIFPIHSHEIQVHLDILVRQCNWYDADGRSDSDSRTNLLYGGLVVHIVLKYTVIAYYFMNNRWNKCSIQKLMTNLWNSLNGFIITLHQ